MEQLNLSWHRLSNGMRVVLRRQAGVHRVSVMLNVGSGSADEGVHGTAHMLEHLMFRGTRAYPSFGAISEAFERWGADFNAFTSREATSFDVSMPAGSLCPVLELLGEVMREPRLTGIAAERDIIREEILSDYDADNSLISVDDWMVSLFYGEPGHPIAGDPGDLSKLTTVGVREFYERHYVASNMLLVISGAMAEAWQVLEWAEHAFGGLPVGAARGVRALGGTAYLRALYGGDVLEPGLYVKRYDGATQSDVSLGFLFGGVGSREFSALEMLVRILDDGMASRLSRRLVDERALVYDVEAFLSTFCSTTLFQIRASCRHRRLGRLLASVYGILREIVRDGILPDELERVRRRVTWEHEELLDGISRLAQWLSSMSLQGMDCELSSDCERLLSVGAEDICEVARQALSGRPHMVVVVGDLGERMCGQLGAVMEEHLGTRVSIRTV